MSPGGYLFEDISIGRLGRFRSRGVIMIGMGAISSGFPFPPMRFEASGETDGEDGEEGESSHTGQTNDDDFLPLFTLVFFLRLLPLFTFICKKMENL